jgi:hypothetical protein
VRAAADQCLPIERDDKITEGNNCFGSGTCNSGIAGINTSGTVLENSYGNSYYYDGIAVSSANNCYGQSQYSAGLYVQSANNCYGYVNASSNNSLVGLLSGICRQQLGRHLLPCWQV